MFRNLKNSVGAHICNEELSFLDCLAIYIFEKKDVTVFQRCQLLHDFFF